MVLTTMKPPIIQPMRADHDRNELPTPDDRDPNIVRGVVMMAAKMPSVLLRLVRRDGQPVSLAQPSRNEEDV